MEDKTNRERSTESDSAKIKRPENKEIETPDSDAVARKAEDEIADKGQPRPFEESWKEQEKFRAD